jgi:hypothetical protein
MRGVWLNGTFLRLWSAQTVSELGSQVTVLALPLTAVIVLHATPLQVGLLGAFQFLPYLLFALAAGTLVDRSRPGPILISADLGRTLVIVSVPLAYLFGYLTVYQIYAVAFAAGTLTVIFGVAQQAALFAMVERDQLVDANSKTELTRSVAAVTGPGLGGLLIGASSAPIALLVDAASFLISAMVLSRIKWSIRGTVDRAHETMGIQVRDGLRFVVHHPLLRSLALGLATLNLFGSIFGAVVIVYWVRELHLSPTIIGLLFAATGFGGVCGAAAVPTMTRWFGVGRVIVAGAAPLGWLLVPLAPATFPVPWLALGGFAASFSLIAFNISQTGLRQAITPDRFQGRMTATMRFLILALVPFGSVIGGVLGSSIGLKPTLWVAVVGGLFTVVPLLLSPLPRIARMPGIGGDQREPAG